MSPEAETDAAPIIVSAVFAPDDQAWLDELRRRHFPPARNHLPAHLTLFHHLPPSALAELAARLVAATAAQAPTATLAGVMKLGRGTALSIRSDALATIRADLAEAFTGLLTPQDQAAWRPHVTVQNKVAPTEAAAVHASLAAGFSPRPIRIAALASWRYRGGPWEPIRRYPFRR